VWSCTVGPWFRSQSIPHQVRPVHSLRQKLRDLILKLSDDIAAAHFYSPQDIHASYTNFDPHTARKWIDQCQLQHVECPNQQQPLLPSRIVDVWPTADSSLVRLHAVLSHHQYHYAALSYAWGTSPRLLTTSSTLEAHQSGLLVKDLPKTFGDAVQVTRDIGLKYIWIDALCIIQDSQSDKMRELIMMRHYYSNARVVIAASSAQAVQEGFLEIEPKIGSATFVLPKMGTELGRFIDIPYYDTDATEGMITLEAHPRIYSPSEEPLNSRSWTLQERLLCPRILIFPSTGGMIWQCNTEERYRGRIFFEHFRSFARQRLLGPTAVYASGDHVSSPEQINTSWLNMVDDYSPRNLTEETDKLVAIAALAEEFHSRHGKQLGKYCAGIWRNYIPQSLHWNVGWYNLERLGNAPKYYRAPSWTWAAVDYATFWHKPDKDQKVAFYIEVEDCTVSPSTDELPFGPVDSGSLTLKGSLKEVFWNSEIQSKTGTSHVYLSSSAQDALGEGVPDTVESRPKVSKHVYFLGLWAHKEADKESGTMPRGILLERISGITFRRIGAFIPFKDTTAEFFEDCEPEVIVII
jgi:Heterokaryon incompatibility protein (HET)